MYPVVIWFIEYHEKINLMFKTQLIQIIISTLYGLLFTEQKKAVSSNSTFEVLDYELILYI